MHDWEGGINDIRKYNCYAQIHLPSADGDDVHDLDEIWINNDLPYVSIYLNKFKFQFIYESFSFLH